MVAPLKSSIQMVNTQNVMKLSKDDFTSIQEQAIHLPLYWNWMDNNQISRPFNQGLCGSCWAVSSAMCLSDVFVASKKTQTNPNLSPTYILSCYPQGQCDGGDPSQAVADMENNGIGPSSCLNYDWCMSTGCSGDPLKHFDERGNVNKYIPPCACSTKSQTQSTTKYFAKNTMAVCIPPDTNDFSYKDKQMIDSYLHSVFSNVPDTHINLKKETHESIRNIIKYNIYTYGPAIGGFHVFSNFMKGKYYETNGIYVENYSYNGLPGVNYSEPDSTWVGSHAVVIVGWGEDTINGEKVPYWVVRNSWGPEWGDRGTFKMAMYGNDPNKKYQNRLSQFEYPSIVYTDNGIGITGGIIHMQAGDISDKPLLKNEVHHTPYQTSPQNTPNQSSPQNTPNQSSPHNTPNQSSPQQPSPMSCNTLATKTNNILFMFILLIIILYFGFSLHKQVDVIFNVFFILIVLLIILQL
jgi:hypothetical protein